MANASLEDLNQGVIYIPFEPGNNANEDPEIVSSEVGLEEPTFSFGDTEEIRDVRLVAFTKAWKRCLERIHEIMDALYQPIAESIVEKVGSAYDESEILPGLPYPEIPVFAISTSSAGSSFINDIAERLGTVSGQDENIDTARTLIAHVYPADCTNIMYATKALMSGFVDQPLDGVKSAKRKPTASLANYDIELLKSWYRAVKDRNETPIQLAVLMHDFEQFNDGVVQDLFYICSLHISEMPLVFILSLSSPPVPSFLHAKYPRSILSLLRIQTFALPAGNELLEKIVEQTFFDINFEPDVMIGPATVEFMIDFFTRHASSIEGIATILRLAHMKHFEEPLTVLTHNENHHATNSLTKAMKQPNALDFLDLLSGCLPSSRPHSEEHNVPRSRKSGQANGKFPPSRTIESLLSDVNRARETFQMYLRRFRIALRMMRVVQIVISTIGYKDALNIRDNYGVGIKPDGTGAGLLLLTEALRGGKDYVLFVRGLARMVRKLSREQLRIVLDSLNELLTAVPEGFQSDDMVANARSRIEEVIHALDMELPDPSSDGEFSSDIDTVAAPRRSEGQPTDGKPPTLAKSTGEWLYGLWVDSNIDLEDLELWDVWYMGSTPFPSEIINPSSRASIVAGLLNPYDFASTADAVLTQSEQHQQTRVALWELPDTSILFRRYLEAGRLINVHDWYESFGMALENQKQHQREVEGENEEADEEEEEWKMHVQARFMRALHELDYVGLIKHTGRKADHVMRTVYEALE